MNALEFDDSVKIYLDELVAKLRVGHAAVMVGSGFSKNVAPNANIPTWDELGNVFYEKLHGTSPTERTSHYLNVMKLADQISEVFGRPVLDALIRKSIPDVEYEPSKLHIDLLELPWADVYTTNYDTFLERATDHIYKKRFSIIENQDGLILKDKPRIIKLHGSFPHSSPLIISEEDYRTYPDNFSPFINTVQQGLLENTLCLIGFSGNDPNFQQWIGWIRDRFGDKTPKIFLVSLFTPMEADRILFEKRNIVVIDLSQNKAKSDDHYMKLSSLFQYLKNKISEHSVDNWLKDDIAVHVDNDNVEKQTQIWSKTRKKYPNWQILSRSLRNKLQHGTGVSEWLLRSIGDNTMALRFLFELNWRFEKSLQPIDNHLIDGYLQILVAYIPKNPKMYANEESDEYKWVELKLSVLRFCREEGKINTWQDWCSALLRIKDNFSQEHKNRLTYEILLFDLFFLKYDDINTTIDSWDVNEPLSFWNVKKAGILAEISRVEEAQNILENLLSKVRKRINMTTNENTKDGLLSQEAYTMLLLRYITDLNKSGSVNHKEMSKRWNEIYNQKYDPWGELDYLNSMLVQPFCIENSSDPTFAFDIGQIIRTTRQNQYRKDIHAAYVYFRFIEECGLPLDIKNNGFFIKTTSGAIERITYYSPTWAISILLRSGNMEIVDRVFNRLSLHLMKTDDVNTLIVDYIDVFKKIRNYSEPHIVKIINVIPDILSCLCTKCTHDISLKILDLLIELYETRRVKSVSKLADRLFKTLPLVDICKYIPKLIVLPIYDNNDYPELFGLFIHFDITEENRKNIGKIDSFSIDTLIKKVEESESKIREYAMYRLFFLKNNQKLSKNNENRLGAATWKFYDEYQLPKKPEGIHFVDFLELNHPKKFDVIKLLKTYTLTFEIIKVEQGVLPDNKVQYVEELPFSIKANNLIWSNDELDRITEKIIKWWDDDKVHLSSDVSGLFNFSVRSRCVRHLENLTSILADIIIPFIHEKRISSKYISEINRLIAEFEEYNMPQADVLVANVLLSPESKEAAIEKIYGYYLSQDTKECNYAYRAVLLYFKLFPSEIPDSVWKIIVDPLMYGLEIKANYAMLVWCSIFETDFSINKIIEKQLKIGLNNLKTITDINLKNNYTLAVKLDIRKAAANLAFTIYLHDISKKFESETQAWREICENTEEFLEIQNCWGKSVIYL